MSMETVSFATAQRGVSPDALRMAHSALRRGAGWQNAAKMSGLTVSDLKQHLLPAPPRPSFSPPAAPPEARRLQLMPVRLPPLACCRESRVIIQATADRFGLTVDDMMSNSRARRIAWPRQAAMTAIRDQRQMSLPAIGRLFGGRDHSTVHHGIAEHRTRQAWCDALMVFANFSDQLELFAVAA